MKPKILLLVVIMTFSMLGLIFIFIISDQNLFLNDKTANDNYDNNRLSIIDGKSNDDVFAAATSKNGSTDFLADNNNNNKSVPELKLVKVNQKEEGSLIGGSTFQITPSPFSNNNRSSLTITDNGTNDQDSAAGIVLLSSIIPRQYTVYEVASPEGFVKDTSIKTVYIDAESTATTTVKFLGQPASSGPNRLEYTARFLCGTIIGEDRPLRPGRYNSDINIFNRQSFPISFLWKGVPSGIPQGGGQVQEEVSSSNSNSSSNFRLQTLGPGNSISISCKDIRASVPSYSRITNDTESFFEGVITISVELDPSIQGAISSSSSSGGTSGTIISSSPLGTGSEPNTNVLSVDAIYTVNALEVASREILLQLIEYTINQQDVSGKIPKDIISDILSITVPIRTNEMVNPDKQVRSILMKEFSLSQVESQSLDISIRNLSLGVGALDDNHALSLQRINAYQPPPSA
jgi:hypothetical protein